jgi:hypothetical protein
MPKKHTAFLYFQLESNEGICFYSTLTYDTHDNMRTITCTSSIEYKQQLSEIIARLTNKLEITVLNEEEIQND